VEALIKMNDISNIAALVADRSALFCHGLIGLLKEHRPHWSCAEAGTFDGMIAHLRTRRVDSLLYDVQLGGSTEPASLRRLRQEFPDQVIVVMADSDERGAILQCLAAGANGYILKSTTLSQLLHAVDTVLDGGVFAPASLAGAPPAISRVTPPGASPLLAHLTDRQVEVFRLLSEGCATKTIARRLGLAVGTVKVHLAAIYRVLDAHNRVEALAKARGDIGHAVATRPLDFMPA
jgi:DNA-binding NarL/FixJ family response regulator